MCALRVFARAVCIVCVSMSGVCLPLLVIMCNNVFIPSFEPSTKQKQMII